MAADPKAELQKSVQAIIAMTNMAIGDVAAELKKRGGSMIEAAKKWQDELEKQILEVPAPPAAAAPPQPAAPEADDDLDIGESKTIAFADGLKRMEEAVAYSGMKYVSLKKVGELQLANPQFALKPTGEPFLHKISKFTREVKEGGNVVYEKDASGAVIYDDKNGVKVPRAKVEHPEEVYLPCVDRAGQKYLLNMNWGFQKEFPAFYKANGLVFFRANVTGSPATKNYKVSIVKA